MIGGRAGTIADVSVTTQEMTVFHNPAQAKSVLGNKFHNLFGLGIPCGTIPRAGALPKLRKLPLSGCPQIELGWRTPHNAPRYATNVEQFFFLSTFGLKLEPGYEARPS